MKNKVRIITSFLFFVLFGALIVGIKKYDVAAIGPEGTAVGFSHINKKFTDLIGTNMTFYKIADYLGYLALAVVAIFAIVGLVQLIKRKGLKAVDREIYALGGLYVVVLGLYAAFEKVIINYRPIIMPDAAGPEASFPSSHTMLTITVMGSAILVLQHFIENDGARILLSALCWLILLGTLATRTLSGVHWLTDIVGGVLISIALLTLFAAVKDGSGSQPRSHARTYSTKAYVPKH